MRFHFVVALFLLCQLSIAQSVSGKIVDAGTGESISYANILLDNSQNLMSNLEGSFTVPAASTDDSTITISFLGYRSQSLTVRQLKERNLVVKLDPGVFELDEVSVSSQKPDPYRIMAEVNKNMDRNYKTDGRARKRTLFYRESSAFKPIDLNVEITESTARKGDKLKADNAQLKALTNSFLRQPPKEYSDLLCNYYTSIGKKDDKPFYQMKLEVLKAVKLKNENQATTMDDMEKLGKEFLFQHLDSTKFYRAKSGIIGSHDTISFANNRKNKQPRQVDITKNALYSFMLQNSLYKNTRMDFITNPNIYEYTYEGAAYSGENEFVYVISFKPDSRKAKYTGKLYISDTDYAVVRTDYTLAEGKKVSGFNLKFLFGVKNAENVSNGTIIYRKNPADSHYYLQYASRENGQYIYVNRPLKFIELTSGDKSSVAFDLKVEGDLLNKSELLTISDTDTSPAAIESMKESEFKYVTLPHYDPNIWKDYGGIEPVEEMKRFKAVN